MDNRYCYNINGLCDDDRCYCTKCREEELSEKEREILKAKRKSLIDNIFN